MKKRVLKFGVDARVASFRGAEVLAVGVRSSLGPYGLDFALDKGNEVTNDGVTIGREISSGGIHDEIEAKGARMLLEAATKTEERGVDGTTTATILAYEITKEAITRLPMDQKDRSKKKKPSEIKLQIKKECEEVVQKLLDMSLKIEDEKTLIKSAMVSTGNKELADLIGKTQWELGPEGYIIAEETAEKISSVERIHGIRTDNGIVSSLAFNNAEKQALELKEIPIILTDYIIKSLYPAFMNVDQRTGINSGLIGHLQARGINKVILIGSHFEGEAIRQCMDNIKNGLEIYPINAPYVDQKEVMKDLAVISGARYISKENSTLESIAASDIGYLSHFIATRHNSIITGKEDDNMEERVKVRVTELREQFKGSMSDFEKKLLEQRIGQLTNGFALLKIGSITELDRKYLKRKADDAVGAVRSALQEGTVAGAGLAFKEISNSLPEDYILKIPLLAINKQIMDSAPEGFKIEKWVRDPVKVLRIALEHACSVASVFANLGGSICEEQAKPIDELFKSKGSSAQPEMELG